MQQAIAAHKEGKLRHAERLYRSVLQAQPKHPDANHNLGVLAVALGKPIEAIPLFKLALDANPKIEQFWLSYIETLISLNNLSQAKQALKEAAHNGFTDEKLSDLRNKLLDRQQDAEPSAAQKTALMETYQKGSLAKAEGLARSMIDEFPEYPLGWRILGVVLAKTSRTAESLTAMKNFVKLSPKDPTAHYNLGMVFQAHDRLDQAVESFKHALILQPDFVQALNNLGNVLARLGRLKDAAESLKAAVLAGPNLPETHGNLASVYRGLGMHTEAKACYGQAIALNSENADMHTNLGITLRDLGELGEAEASLQRAIELQPQSGEAFRYLGLTLHDLGRFAEAEAAFGRAIDGAPSDSDVYLNMGMTLLRLGKLKEAELHLNVAIERDPERAEAQFSLGVVLQETGRLDEAELSFRRAIALKPELVESHINLGVTLSEIGRLKEAGEVLAHATALDPDSAEAHGNLGAVLHREGKLSNAVASLKRALLIKPGFVEARCNLAKALQGLGQFKQAEASLREAISIKPEYAEAQFNLGVTLRALGKLDEAEVSLRQAILLKGDYAEAYRALALDKKFEQDDEQFLQMLELHQSRILSEKDHSSICFALAKALDGMGDFGSAYQFFKEGNTLRKQLLGYDKGKEAAVFKSLRENYPALAAHSLPKPDLEGSVTPIFIVGMPRSGTTLVEQIISAHSLVTGAGELPYVSELGKELAAGVVQPTSGVLREFRANYQNALLDHSEGNAVVTDKMPQNFLFLGLIASAFPDAHIIHVTRKPAAVCWANYATYFTNEGLNYCYSVDDILSYYELYWDLMNFWHASLPGRIYSLDYDNLTRNQEADTRSLINYLGLKWDECCLSPHKNRRSVANASSVQVRRKIYEGSSEHWRNYQPFLDGALDKLGSRADALPDL